MVVKDCREMQLNLLVSMIPTVLVPLWGYQKYSTQNSVHVCSGHGTCSSGLCDEDEITCTGAGTCDCDVGYEGAVGIWIL